MSSCGGEVEYMWRKRVTDSIKSLGKGYVVDGLGERSTIVMWREWLPLDMRGNTQKLEYIQC